MRAIAVALLLLAISLSSPVLAFSPEELDQAALVAGDIDIVEVIADDIYLGRQNNTPESTAVQSVLIAALSEVADGLNSSQTGDAAYKQPFSTGQVGTNLLAVIPGTDLASQYVMIGAHYDHLGADVSGIYNGATDNASGVAIVLAVGKAIASLPTPPRRSVILALWDAEEWQGPQESPLQGSIAYANAPLVPLSSTVAYVNVDIQGANLLPSLRNMSFAIGAETGGTTLRNLVQAEVAKESVDTRQLSRMFGQDRGDHATFIAAGLPSVFFSDATGACYHTTEDDIDVVDQGKLAEQSRVAFRVVVALAETSTPPAFVTTSLFVNTYADAVQVAHVINGGVADIALFPPAQQDILEQRQAEVQAIVAGGAAAYGFDDQQAVAFAALATLGTLPYLPCDGYLLSPPIPSSPPPLRIALVIALALTATLGLLARRRRAAG